MTAIIDADVVLHHIGHKFTHDMGGRFFIPSELPQAFAACDRMIEDIRTQALCNLVLLAFSDRHNYRKVCVPTYKANRSSARRPDPTLMGALRAYMESTYYARTWAFLEGDDVLGILGSVHTGDCVLCTVDKDLDTIPGLHYRWHHPEWGVFEVDTEMAHYSLQLQLLMGDSTDGFPGLKGVGPKKAAKMIADEDFSCVYDAYHDVYGDSDEFFKTSVQALILQVEDLSKTKDDMVSLWLQVTADDHRAFTIGRIDLDLPKGPKAC